LREVRFSSAIGCVSHREMLKKSIGRIDGESIPDPRFAEKISRLGRVWLDLLAQLSHQDPQVFRLVHGVRSPDRLQDDTMRQDTVGIMSEQGEQLEFLWRQPDLIG